MFMRACSTLLLCLLLTACEERSTLHSRLSEQDANEVIAQLADNDIQASKRTEKDGMSVLVAPADLNSAVRVLEAAGLPRRSRASLGDIFRKEGVISTPLEERARYIYALSQELESTLSQIDGVVLARVHVVLPERVAPGEPVQPASASVFIKHTGALDPDSITPRVRNLIASGIPGMADAAHNTSKLSVVFQQVVGGVRAHVALSGAARDGAVRAVPDEGRRRRLLANGHGRDRHRLAEPAAGGRLRALPTVAHRCPDAAARAATEARPPRRSPAPAPHRAIQQPPCSP